MSSARLRWAIITVFSITVGHCGWLTFWPRTTPAYYVGGEIPALIGSSEAKNLYLRRSFHLSQRPRHAWLQVLSGDRLNLYVNGDFVASRTPDGTTQGVVVDITRYLRVGPNVVAIAAHQHTIGHPPSVAVDGVYTFGESERPLGVDGLWRCSSVSERTSHWWFSTEFNDRHWPSAIVTKRSLRARMETPPRAVKAARKAHWISPCGVDTVGFTIIIQRS